MAFHWLARHPRALYEFRNVDPVRDPFVGPNSLLAWRLRAVAKH